MTFLELCQRMRQEVGSAGHGPSTVESQSGEYARLVGWVRQAWVDIQVSRSDWRFAWGMGSVEVVYDFREYPMPDDFDHWDRDSLRLHDVPLTPIPWEVFRERYREPTGSGARHVTLSPDGVLHLDDFPSRSGDLTFEYWKTPQVLSANTSVPRMPEQYHMLIVYRAMRHYGLYENAPEVVQQATLSERELMNRMAITELPSVALRGSLV